MNKKYHVVLHYGFTDEESGIYHSFEMKHPDDKEDINAITERLAESLDSYLGSRNFAHLWMSIELPDEVVSEIRDDAIEDYKDSVYADAY